MSIESKNIEIGEGDFTIKFEGAAEATDVGACEGAELSVANKYKEVECGQTLDPIEAFLIGRDIKFKIDLKEDTMRNVVIALGGDPDDITSDLSKEVYEFPALSVSTTPFLEAIYTVKRVIDKTKVKSVQLYKCKGVGNFKYAYKKDKERVFTLELKAFADPTHDNKPGKLEFDLVPSE